MNFLLEVYNGGVVGDVSSGSSEPSNKNWNQHENNEFTDGFIAGFFIALALCIVVKLSIVGFSKLLRYVSKPNKTDKKSD